MLSVGFDRYGSEEELVRDPIQHLFKVYVRINQDKTDETERFNKGEITDAESTVHAAAKRVFKAMEDGEPRLGRTSFAVRLKQPNQATRRRSHNGADSESFPLRSSRRLTPSSTSTLMSTGERARCPRSRCSVPSRSARRRV